MAEKELEQGKEDVVRIRDRSDIKVLMLNGEQLRTLAKLIHKQEENRMMSIPFSSEKERSQYLRESREAYQKTIETLDEATKLQQEQLMRVTNDQNQTLGEIILHYLHYIEYFFNTGLRLVWNLHLRLEFIGKLREHANGDLIPQINSIKERLAAGGLEGDELEALEAEGKELVRKLTAYENVHFDIMVNKETPGPRNLSKALKKKGTSFEKLVEEYQQKLVREKGPEYGGLFEDLEDAQKIEVYDEIIKSTGRASLLEDKVALIGDAVGISVILLTLGLTVWDIYSSEHKVQTAVEDGTQLVASMVGSFGGEFVGAAIGTTIGATTVGAETAAAVATAVGVEVTAVTSAFVFLTAVATGFGAAIALGALTGWLVSKIFATGGKHASKVVTVQGQNSPPPPPKQLPPSLYNKRIYVTPMPNGDVLARQIAYQGRK